MLTFKIMFWEKEVDSAVNIPLSGPSNKLFIKTPWIEKNMEGISIRPWARYAPRAATHRKVYKPISFMKT